MHHCLCSATSRNLLPYLPVVEVLPNILGNYDDQVVYVVVFIRRDSWTEIKGQYRFYRGICLRYRLCGGNMWSKKITSHDI